MKKLILICLVNVLMSGALKGQQQVSAEGKSGLAFLLKWNVGQVRSNFVPNLPNDWPTRFYPPSANMSVVQSTRSWFLELELGIEPAWWRNQWRIGIPISYTLGGITHTRFFGLSKPVSITNLKWWDTVDLQGVFLRKTSPRVGISLERDSERGGFSVIPSFQSYRLEIRDYEGEDCQNCPNTSHVIAKRQIGQGLAPRVDVILWIKADETDEYEAIGIGVFAERLYGVWQLGVTIPMSLRMAGRGRWFD